MTEVPETQFAWLGEDRIAYQVLGDGPVDLVYLPSVLAGPIDSRWDFPPYASFLQRLASFSRLIMFDRRGTGASDPVPLDALPSWEEWNNDIGAVLDALDSERAVIYGFVDSGPTAILYAATRPERTQALILGNTTSRFLVDDDYPGGLAQTEVDAAVEFIEANWGSADFAAFAHPGFASGSDVIRWLERAQRAACSPREASAYLRQVQLTDVRDVLGLVRVPTLVIHRKDAGWITCDQGRYLADRIPGARFEMIAGQDLALYMEPSAEALDHVEDFLATVALPAEPDRALAAVLFTDFVDSTKRLAVLGDRAWRDLLDSHDVLARTVVEQHRGRLVRTTGDGILATFDGPGRAVRCAVALNDALRPLVLEIRAGLHTGEIELRGNDIAGIGVHIAARVVEAAEAGELLVSGAVPMLVAGSGIEFEDRGEHELKGVPGSWQLFAVRP